MWRLCEPESPLIISSIVFRTLDVTLRLTQRRWQLVIWYSLLELLHRNVTLGAPSSRSGTRCSNTMAPGYAALRQSVHTRDRSSAGRQLLSYSDRGISKHYVHWTVEPLGRVGLMCKHGGTHEAAENRYAK